MSGAQTADTGDALLNALRENELEEALRLAALREQALRALDPGDSQALARAREVDREIAATAEECGKRLREEIDAVQELRGRLSRRPRARRGARFINRRA